MIKVFICVLTYPLPLNILKITLEQFLPRPKHPSSFSPPKLSSQTHFQHVSGVFPTPTIFKTPSRVIKNSTYL